jgi:large subunit ribosomal protein L18
MSRKSIQLKQAQKRRRAARVRSRISGTAERPRLSVFRSAKHVTAQMIDDANGVTLISSSDTVVEAQGKKPVEVAALVGADLGKKALAAGIKTVIFDRGSYRYHGRIKALADAARAEGIEF